MIHFGRMRVASELLATACAVGLLTVAFMPVLSFAALYPYLVDAQEVSNHGLSTLTMVAFWITTGLFSIPVGWLVDRAPLWSITGAGALVMSAGLVLAGAVGTQLAIIAGFGFLGGVGSAAIGAVPNFAAVSRFVVAGRRRRIALGVAATGMGLSAVAIRPVASIVSSVGLQGGLWFLAALTLGASAPFVCAYFALERRTVPVQDPPGCGKRGLPVTGRWSRRQAMRTPTFWLLFAAAWCAPAAIQVMLVHQVAIIQERGGSYAAGVAAATVLGLASIGWRVVASGISGVVGRTWTYGAAVVLSLSALGILASGVLLPAWPERGYLYAVLFSAGYGAFAPMFPAASIDLFGRESFAAIHGVLYVGLGFGAAAGSWMGGWLRDLSGSYDSALAFSAAMIAVSSIMYGLSNYTRGYSAPMERRERVYHGTP